MFSHFCMYYFLPQNCTIINILTFDLLTQDTVYYLLTLVGEFRFFYLPHCVGLPSGSVVNNLPANTGDMGLIPGSGRSPGEENRNPFQYSCLGNPMDKRSWWAIVHWGYKGVRNNLATKQQKQEQYLSEP